MLMHRLSRHEKAATQRAHRADLHSLYRLRWQRFEFAADEGRHAEGVEYATLEWGYCFNHRRLLEPIGNILPAEAEVKFVAALSVELGLSDAERTELMPSGKQTVIANRIHWAKMCRFQAFKGRSLNSHCPRLERHRSMYRKFENMRLSLGLGRELSVDQLIDLVNTR
jgi:hypothetical protein